MSDLLWFSLGGLLIIVEVVSPTFFFLWPGLACLLTGVLVWLYPESGFALQLAVAALLTLAFALAWKGYYKKNPLRGNDPELNRRGDQMIGKTCVVTESIENGKGRVAIGDSSWLAVGPDCPANTPVEVVGIDGNALKVKIAKN